MDTKKRSILITGVSHFWGRQLASILEDNPEIDPIIGIDFIQPEVPFKRLKFFQIDLDNPLIPELLKTAEIDTVCHLLFLESYAYQEEFFSLNVMGTMDLLASCAAAGDVSKVIFISDTRVYGANYTNPSFLSEDSDLKARYSHRYIQDRLETERYLSKFAKQNSKLKVTTLRFANILGNKVETPIGRYLNSMVVPTVLGYDPMFQFTHVDDVFEALVCAIQSDVSGPFNIAGDGPLPLSQVLRVGAKIALPIASPVLNLSYKFYKKLGILNSILIESDFLKYSCVGDTARMKNILKFLPKYSSSDVVKDFFEKRRVSKYLPSKPKIKSDPKSSEALSKWLKERRQASHDPSDLLDHYAELIDNFDDKEQEHANSKSE